MGIDVEMYVALSVKINDADLATLNKRAVEAFGAEIFYGAAADPCCALGRVSQSESRVQWPYTPDGDVLEVHLYWRYFGPGYERGPGDQIVAMARWLEANARGVVWYGSDAGERVSVFGEDEQDAMLKMWHDSTCAGLDCIETDCIYRSAFIKGACAQEASTLTHMHEQLRQGVVVGDLMCAIKDRLAALDNGAEPSCLQDKT